MVPLKSSYDAEGFFDDDELEDLLKAEPFDDTNPDSDGATEVIHSRAPWHLTHRHKKTVQSYPGNSHVGRIIKRLEREKTPLPSYLFWPWPKIRAFCNCLTLLVFLGVVAAPIWSMIQLVTQHPECMVSLNGAHVASEWWSDGPWFRIDGHPEASLIDVNAAILREYGVQTVWLGSSEWLRNIHLENDTLSTNSTGLLEDIGRVTHENGLKLLLSIHAAKVICQLDQDDEKCATPDEEASPGASRTIPADGVNAPINWESLFSSLVAAGVDGFYLADLRDLPKDESEHILDSVSRAVGNDSEVWIISATDSSLPDSVPSQLHLVAVDEVIRPSTAYELNRWVDLRNGVNTSDGRRVTHVLMPASHGEDMTDLNMRLLAVLLPGVPMLDQTSVEDLTTGRSDNQTQLGMLLELRKNSAALQGDDLTMLKDHLESNVFAMLRTYKEDKRYLVLWNFNNSTVSLDFHQLSMRGNWVFRSVLLEPVRELINLRYIDDLQASELGVIELP